MTRRLWPLLLIPILVVRLALPRYNPPDRAGSDARASLSEDNGSYPLNGRKSPSSAASQESAQPHVVTLGDGAETAGSVTPRPSVKLGDWSCSDPPLCGETPQPRIVDGISGWATYWNSFGSGLYVALRPDLGSKGDLVIVCGGAPFHCKSAPVITSCACLGPNSERLVDLSRDLFAEFADPSAGVVRIVLQVIDQ